MPEEQAAPAAEPKPLKASEKPDGWEKLRREGDPAGPAEVGYDAKRHRNYHVNRLGGIVFHEIPEGFTFRDGELVAKESK